VFGTRADDFPTYMAHLCAAAGAALAVMAAPPLRLIRSHGVLAPNARLRPKVVPQKPADAEQTSEPTDAAECDIDTARAARRHQLGVTDRAGVRHQPAALPELWR
jgi:hypothetical protein